MSVDFNQVHENVEKAKNNQSLQVVGDILTNIVNVPDVVTPISQITEHTVGGIGHAVSNIDPTNIAQVASGVGELGIHAVGAAIEIIGSIVSGL